MAVGLAFFWICVRAGASQRARRNVEFKRGDSGEIVTKDGVRLGFTDFKASDGAVLRVLYWDFENQTDATEVLDKEVAQATKIIERAAKRDRAGKLVGERVEVEFPSTKPHEILHGILWTDGPKFHEIQSIALSDLRELEKVYK